MTHTCLLDITKLRYYRALIEAYVETDTEAGAVTITHWLRREHNVRADSNPMQRFMDWARD